VLHPDSAALTAAHVSLPPQRRQAEHDATTDPQGALAGATRFYHRAENRLAGYSGGALLAAKDAADAVFAFRYSLALALGLAAVFLFFVLVCYVLACVFHSDVLCAEADTAFRAVNLCAFGQQMLACHQCHSLVTTQGAEQ